jgi:hypothetical protein
MGNRISLDLLEAVSKVFKENDIQPDYRLPVTKEQYLDLCFELRMDASAPIMNGDETFKFMGYELFVITRGEDLWDRLSA